MLDPMSSRTPISVSPPTGGVARSATRRGTTQRGCQPVTDEARDLHLVRLAKIERGRRARRPARIRVISATSPTLTSAPPSSAGTRTESRRSARSASNASVGESRVAVDLVGPGAATSAAIWATRGAKCTPACLTALTAPASPEPGTNDPHLGLPVPMCTSPDAFLCVRSAGRGDQIHRSPRPARTVTSSFGSPKACGPGSTLVRMGE